MLDYWKYFEQGGDIMRELKVICVCGMGVGSSMLLKMSLEEIFYSPSLNTCVVWLKAIYSNGSDYMISYDLYDLLEKNPIKTAIVKEAYIKYKEELKSNKLDSLEDWEY